MLLDAGKTPLPYCGCPRFQAYNVVKIDGDGTDRPDDGRRVRYSHCANCGRTWSSRSIDFHTRKW